MLSQGLYPDGYVVILSSVCTLLSSLLLSAILLISSVYTLFAWFLNLWCDFNIISSFNKQFLQSLKFGPRFITHFFAFNHYYHRALSENMFLV